jgi:transcriptional regulator with XRE-family HTH domain
MKSIYEAEYQAIIERLATRRKELGLSQTELAQRLGPEFDQTIISKIETYLRRIDIIETKRICEALDIEILDLFRKTR